MPTTTRPLLQLQLQLLQQLQQQQQQQQQLLLLLFINVKKNCCFITMCKAHRKVTHIKQQIYFHHLKRPGYNTEFLLYPRPFR